MSFQQGLSGLNAAAKNLDVIGNNVANSGTVGFKQSQAQFADVYANSLSGAGGANVGIGTKVAQVSQQFTQGNITATNNPLDMAINGGGFFRMDNNGEVTYQRNGQFQFDRMGFIVNPTGAKLTGYTADASGVLSTGSPAPLSINTADLAPQITSEVEAVLNLDSGEAVPATTPFNISDPTSFNRSTPVSVFDSLGNAQTLQMFYVKTANPGEWDVYAASDGVQIGAGAVATLNFNTSGILTTTPMPLGPINVPATASGATPTFPVTLDITGTTQLGSAYSINTLHQRFREAEIGIFQRLGAEIVAVWQRMDDPNTLVWMLAYRDRAHRDEVWAAFRTDPEWVALLEKYPVPLQVQSYMLSSADYSPMK